MARYEVPTPSTLLLRMSPPRRAVPALRMLDECLPGARDPAPPGARVSTLSDVSSDGTMLPLAACLVWYECGAPQAWLTRFAVPVAFRRRGLGRRLLAELGRTLRSEGAERLWVRLGGDRIAMRALLVRDGFVISPAEPRGPVPAGFAAGEDGLSWWVRDL